MWIGLWTLDLCLVALLACAISGKRHYVDRPVDAGLVSRGVARMCHFGEATLVASCGRDKRDHPPREAARRRFPWGAQRMPVVSVLRHF